MGLARSSGRSFHDEPLEAFFERRAFSRSAEVLLVETIAAAGHVRRLALLVRAR
jgi:hypothetical protein